MRFYHGRIAAKSFNSGEDFEDLKNVVIIMIMPYDPFGYNRMVYTVKNKCVELPDMEYEDGAGTMFLYTKGTEDIPCAAVEQLMHYMEDTTVENAVNEELREMHRMVETVRNDSEMVRMRVQILEENYELWQKTERQAEELTMKEKENATLAAENTKQAKELTKKDEELTKQAKEIKKLREKLKLYHYRRDGSLIMPAGTADK